MLGSVVVAVLVGALAVPTGARSGPGALDEAVAAALLDRAHLTRAEARAAGRTAQVTVHRQQGRSAFGTAVLAAPPTPDGSPLGALFLARLDVTWRVALDGTPGFASLAREAPTAVMSTVERDVLTGRTAGVGRRARTARWT